MAPCAICPNPRLVDFGPRTYLQGSGLGLKVSRVGGLRFRFRVSRVWGLGFRFIGVPLRGLYGLFKGTIMVKGSLIRFL